LCYKKYMKKNELARKLRKKRIVSYLSSVVKKKPFKTWLVGGCIRDTFLGIPVRDYDIVITGNAQDVSMCIAKDLGGNQFCLDSNLEEYRIMLSRNRIIDVKSIQDISHDLKQRDFTINALAFSLVDLETFSDPFNGIADLRRKRMQVVSSSVFAKDPLRLLRMFRLACTLGFSLPDDSIALAKRSVRKIDSVARERIRTELMLLFESSKSYRYVKRMDAIGLIAALFPEVEKGKRIPQHKYRSINLKEHSLVCYDIMEKIIDKKGYSVFTGFETVFKSFIHKHKALLKLAALLHDIGKLYTMREDPSGTVCFWMHEKKGELRLKDYYQQRLSLSNREIEILSLLVLHHMRAHLLSREKIITNHALYRFVKDGKDVIPGILLLTYADSIASSGTGKEVKRIEETIEKIIGYFAASQRVKIRKQLITGHDLIKQFGLKPGPIFKTILEAIEKKNIEGVITTKGEALKFARKLITQLQ